MFTEIVKTMQWGGKTLTLETGKIARQATGAVIASLGGTKILCAVTAAKSVNPDMDFFPLTVNYQEKYYASGKIPGGYFRREARPSERETLISRLIDRPIRPLFHERFKNETQVVLTVLEHDLENESDIVAMIGASAALTISGVPFLGPLGASRVGFKNGEYVLNPAMDEISTLDLDLVVAGTRDGVLMVESEAQQLSEQQMLDAVAFGAEKYAEVIDFIIKFAQQSAREPWDLAEVEDWEEDVKADIENCARKGLVNAYKIVKKQDRVSAVSVVKESTLDTIKEKYGDHINYVKVGGMLKKLEADIVRSDILQNKTRIDGRGLADVRHIATETGLLPRTHGSALFTRGETQAIVVATLGTASDEQMVDGLDGLHKQSFLLHYNFPPYSVGEVGRMGATGRREIGHGKLAWRAINPLLPNKEEFPYTIRVVSEITESNGSSSMASVCGSSMALMDAGVPLKQPCAGIAMGLIKEGDDYAVLSDIMGDEDHLGDMDFKVAGTAEGITSLQMDIKITSITQDIMKNALAQAKKGREHILDEMAKTISVGRDEVSDMAPKMETFKIHPDKIREVIGTGGKVIREITETTGAKIDIEEDGTIRVAAVDGSALQSAMDWIQGIVAEPEVGKIYTGTVARCVDFGAFVTFMPNRDGLVHISEMQNKRTARTTDVVNEGDSVFVKCIGIDNKGKVKLSMKVIDQKTGKEL